MKNQSKLFELGETMRKASMAAYDINRSIQKLSKVDPQQAREFELKAIEGLLDRVRVFEVADQGSNVETV